MFTGLTVEPGEIISLEKRTDSARLYVKGKEVVKDATNGDSIAINGACLTVVNIERDILSFDVSHETLRSTNLGSLKRGDRVNLEPSLRLNSKLGGHFVAGHVDGVGKIKTKTLIANTVNIEIETPDNVLKYLVEKGSVTVDGISLTVVNVLVNIFTIVVIPHTIKLTTIGFKNVGDIVNLESDILGKYAARFLQTDKDRDASFLSTLKQSGFV